MPSSLPPLLRFLDAGDSAVAVEFGSDIDAGINDRVLALDAALQTAAIPGIVETVPTYRSLLVHTDPLVFDAEAFQATVHILVADGAPTPRRARRWRVPVVYGGAFGIDLEAVAAMHNLTTTQVIDRHAGALYRVYMIGFMPGFTYLGGLDPVLATPRRRDPRPTTPAGIISIGGVQALIAGAANPSGWHSLGRTPVVTFKPQRDPPVLFAPGDEIQFEPISAARWPTLEAAGLSGFHLAELITL